MELGLIVEPALNISDTKRMKQNVAEADKVTKKEGRGGNFIGRCHHRGIAGFVVGPF